MKYSIIFVAAISCLLLLSCSKSWLDIKADDNLSVPQTLQDFQNLLDDVTQVNIYKSALGEIAADGHYVTDAVFEQEAKSVYTDAYIWDNKQPNLANDGNNTWATEYKTVLYANVILDGLEKIKATVSENDAMFRNIKGQALFTRAFAFYRLSQVYCPPYQVNAADNEYGLVLRLDVNTENKSVRSSIKKTYQQITEDLLTALDLLPPKPEILTRASKMSVLALLSRTYLAIGDFANSLKYGLETLKIHGQLLDYNTIPVDAISIGRYNTEVLYHSSLNPMSFISFNCLISGDLYDLYKDGDLRKEKCFQVTTNGIVFKGNYNTDNFQVFNGLAADEVYLNIAESLIREGQVAEGMKYLNILYKARWDAGMEFGELEAANATEAIDLVLAERRKELILRSTRWTDLRRLNTEPGRAITLTRKIGTSTYTLLPNSYRYTFEIPSDVIKMANLKQNPSN